MNTLFTISQGGSLWADGLSISEVEASIKSLALHLLQCREDFDIGEPDVDFSCDDVTGPGGFQASVTMLRSISGGFWEGQRMPSEEVADGPTLHFTVLVDFDRSGECPMDVAS
jgi:hypothetical protein